MVLIRRINGKLSVELGTGLTVTATWQRVGETLVAHGITWMHLVRWRLVGETSVVLGIT